jgi:hypothetical protein
MSSTFTTQLQLGASELARAAGVLAPVTLVPLFVLLLV